MATSDLIRLKQIKVEGLFVFYCHAIDLKLNDQITLLHGPNGVGETSVLRMTNALLSGQFDLFRSVPFSQISLLFDDGVELELKQIEEIEEDSRTHMLRLSNGVNQQSAPLNLKQLSPREIERQIDYLRPLESDSRTWIDLRDDEVLSAAEVMARYGRIPIEGNMRDSASVLSHK
ncbi:MAG: hypothetical protein OXF72_00765 [Gammaproteobacteria bacterium]|nr:hypothetical protein [Gammaproteobacteria bacterium]MCY4323819.1 hypothetical protein [Gammaproteobacteria bacterium]